MSDNQTDAEWEYAIWSEAGEHLWPLGPQDEEFSTTLDACLDALGDKDPDFWDHGDHIVKRLRSQWAPIAKEEVGL